MRTILLNENEESTYAINNNFIAESLLTDCRKSGDWQHSITITREVSKRKITSTQWNH